ECSRECRSGGNRILFLNASHCHTHMLTLNDNSNTCWIQCLLDTVSDFVCQTFLNLKTTCKSIYHTWNLTQSYNMTIWNIRNMGFTEKWQHMVFTHRIYFYI